MEILFCKNKTTNSDSFFFYFLSNIIFIILSFGWDLHFWKNCDSCGGFHWVVRALSLGQAASCLIHSHFCRSGSFVNLNNHSEIGLVLSWPIRFHFSSHWGFIPNVCKEYLLISKGGGCSNTWIESTWKWVARDIVLVSKPASYIVPAHLKASEHIRAWKCYWGKLIEIGPHKKKHIVCICG